jgi:hypothetical protein
MAVIAIRSVFPGVRGRGEGGQTSPLCLVFQTRKGGGVCGSGELAMFGLDLLTYLNGKLNNYYLLVKIY